MCGDDDSGELLCCLCAPIAAIFCCKFCKDKMGSNNVSQAPGNSFYPERDDRTFESAFYDRRYPPNQAAFDPGYSRQQYPPQAFQENYYSRNNMPPIHFQHQPRQY